MKKIKLLLISLGCMFLMPISVLAASGKINVTGTSTAVVGNKVTITITLSSSIPIGSWEMQLNYDKSYLQLLSTTSESNGVRMANSSATGVKSKSYTFTFKTLKTGSTSVSVNRYDAYAYEDLSKMSLTSGTKSVKIITQAELEASYSKNNNLKDLGVKDFELSSEFKKDTLEYSVVVPENTKEIEIVGTVEDRNSTVTGLGKKEVNAGSNKFEIVVKAQNGGEKTYVIIVEVKDENPINVSLNGNNYTVVKLREYLPEINLYNEYNVSINEFEIPAYKNEYTNVVLVGLKDDNGNIGLFIYNEDSKTYREYHEIGVNKITIYPLESKEEIMGYKKSEIKIGDATVKGYIYNDNSNFVIIYGVNIETGDKGFYMYDKKMQTLIEYNDEVATYLNEKIEMYTYIIFGFVGLTFLMLIIIIVLATKRGKKKKRNKDKEIKSVLDDDKNKIEEIN